MSPLPSRLSTELDHIVIVAATLDQGVQFCSDVLGVAPSGGGEHARIGTHNRLLYLGPGLYLEVIAINPNAAPSPVPRWFGMDDPQVRERIDDTPVLLTFVARTNDIATVQRQMPELGSVQTMQRGDLQWQITLAADGGLCEEGCLPAVIAWPQGVHPSANLPDTGCRLLSLEVCHPEPERLEARWRQIGLAPDGRLLVRAVPAGEPARLVAHISTPSGIRTLG